MQPESIQSDHCGSPLPEDGDDEEDPSVPEEDVPVSKATLEVQIPSLHHFPLPQGVPSRAGPARNGECRPSAKQRIDEHVSAGVYLR